MNTGRVVGVICLAAAALLAILNLALPAGSMIFMAGEENMPWIPPVILGIVGIVLLASAGRRGQEAEIQAPDREIVVDPQKSALNKRLETIALGCYLIALGGFWLVPHTWVGKGIWSIVAGLILLGLNAARYVNHIKMSGFTTFLGIVSLLGGVAQLLGMRSLEGALFWIILGAYLIVKPWFDSRQLFGKAEES